MATFCKKNKSLRSFSAFLLFLVFLTAATGLRADNIESVIRSPSHYGGDTFLHLELSENGTAIQTSFDNDSGGAIEWVIERDGQIVLQRNARNDNSYRYFGRAPGSYKIYVRQSVNGNYEIISNVLGYVLASDGTYAPLIEQAPPIQKGIALLRLPVLQNYYEIEYELRNGRAYYQGDIDLGPISQVRSKTAKNIRAFRSGLLDKTKLRLQTNTNYLDLKETLNVPAMDHYIDLTRQQAALKSAVLRNPDDLWPDGRVPYEITGNFSSRMLNRIENAIEDINDETVVNIVPKTDEDVDFVEIVMNTDPDEGGSSAIGKIGGAQSLTLSDPSSVGVIIHEFGHALGLHHTQTRWDRDNFVCVNLDQVEEGRAFNFNIVDDRYVAYGPYNTESIMHYNSCAFSACQSDCRGDLENCATVLPKIDGVCEPDYIDYHDNNLEQSDIDAINWLYTDLGALEIDPDEPDPLEVSVTIESLIKTRGPEENGWGCNDRMDFFATIQIYAVSENNGSYYVQSHGISNTFEKFEGNNISPSNWSLNLPLRSGDRYAIVQVDVLDDDKSGFIGIGRCGGEDDQVSVQSYNSRDESVWLLIDTYEEDPARQVIELSMRDLPSSFGEQSLGDFISLPTDNKISFTGDITETHAANMILKVIIR